MLAILTLTEGAKVTAEKIKETYDKEVLIYSKPFNKPFKEVVLEVFENFDQILFIMASGIVVRTIGPLLKHKSTDPAILVMDEKANFVISLVSGHLGGANELAYEISSLFQGCLPVITTASDVNDLLSVDMLAKKYNLLLTDYEGAKKVTSKLVDGFKVGLISDLEIKEENYEEYSEHVSCVVEVTNKVESFNTELPYVKLIQRNLVLGMGCKRNTSYENLSEFVNVFLNTNGYLSESVSKISSAWVKADETAIKDLARYLNIEFETYEKEEIKLVEDNFEKSEFVHKTLGVGSVSEPCGYLASNYGKMLVGINRHNGMTLSLWEIKGV